MFTYLVPSSRNETSSHKDCSGDKGIPNGFSTTRAQIDYTRLVTTVATSSISSLTTTATSSTSSADGKRLNTSASHLKTRFYATDLFQVVNFTGLWQLH